MKHDDEEDRGRAASSADFESLEQQVVYLNKQLIAQREAFDIRGRALIATRNDNYRLHSEPLRRFWSGLVQVESAPASDSERIQEREARFRETEALTRRLMETEQKLADARRELSDRRAFGLVGKVRTLARKLLRR